MSGYNAIFLNDGVVDLPKEILEWKDTVLSNNLIFGRKTFEELAQQYFEDKTVWVLTKENKYGWLQSNHKGRNWINIVTNLVDLPDNLNYTVCGGAETFALFKDKIKEAYSIYNGQDSSPFKDFLKTTETVLTKDEISVIKYS